MKIVIITGSSRGLGASAAIECARKGMGVVVTYNSSPDQAEGVVTKIMQSGGKAVALKLDVGNTGSFPAFRYAVAENCSPYSPAATSTISSTTPATACSIRSPP